MKCKFCRKLRCDHCPKCGQKVVIGSFPFCPHAKASKGNRSGFESYTDTLQFPTDMTFHSASEIDRAAKANKLEVRSNPKQKGSRFI